MFFNQLANDMRFGASGIEEQTSNEHRLALFDKAVSVLKKNNGQRDFISRRIGVLVDLGRDEEAEQVLLELAATTNIVDRIHWLGALGDFYFNRSYRYYAVEFYTMFGFNRQNRGGEFPNRNERFCEALFATGHYRECLENIASLPTWGSLRDRNEQYRRVIEAKIKEQGAAAAK